jgi:hypothetical protein
LRPIFIFAFHNLGKIAQRETPIEITAPAALRAAQKWRSTNFGKQVSETSFWVCVIEIIDKLFGSASDCDFARIG